MGNWLVSSPLQQDTSLGEQTTAGQYKECASAIPEAVGNSKPYSQRLQGPRPMEILSYLQ